MNFPARARAAGSNGGSSVEAETWVDREVAGCEFSDERLAKRFRKLLGLIGSTLGGSIPLVCQDWANTKAAYRFFSNDRVSEEEILTGHFQSTRDRIAAQKLSERLGRQFYVENVGGAGGNIGAAQAARAAPAFDYPQFPMLPKIGLFAET